MMKKFFKRSNWLVLFVSGLFGLMLVLNVMVGLDFEKDKFLPSLTLFELGNMAFAQGETSPGGQPCGSVHGAGGELFIVYCYKNRGLFGLGSGCKYDVNYTCTVRSIDLPG